MDTSVLFMTGGLVGGDINTFGSAIVEITGGSITTFLQPNDSSFVTLSGGLVGSKLNVVGTSTLQIFGSNFMVDDVPVPFGDLTAMSGVLTLPHPALLGGMMLAALALWRRTIQPLPALEGIL